jgi:hypothetical protein
MCKVFNVKEVGKRAAADRVYVGRPSKWGNPFVIGRDGTRDEVIAKYRAWIVRQPALMAALGELKRKDLVCWCAPELSRGGADRAREQVISRDASGLVELPGAAVSRPTGWLSGSRPGRLLDPQRP